MVPIRLLRYFLIFLLFYGCESPNRLLNFPQEFDTKSTLKQWNMLLLSEEDFPKESVQNHRYHINVMKPYMQSNPGFISLKKFTLQHPDHPLSNLRHWYYAYFYSGGIIWHYMVMEFPSSTQAQHYLNRLRSPVEMAEKLYRVGSILFFYKFTDLHDKLLPKLKATEGLEWAKMHFEKVRNAL